jgi:arginase
MAALRNIDLIEAPSNLGLKPPKPGKQPGVRHAPDALAKAGLTLKLQYSSRRRVAAPTYQADESREINIRNAKSIAAYTEQLATEVTRSLINKRFPLMIGGDCSILLGPAVALRQRGRYGLLFIDGHTDFFLPEQSSTGGAAGMDLALATGWGPDLLSNIKNLGPYFRTEDVLLLGNRDYSERPVANIPKPEQSGMDYCDLDKLRAAGVVPAAQAHIDTLNQKPTDGFWIHLDVDALNDSIMPAVDSPQADGLSWDEITAILGYALNTGRAIGMEITIFDPDLDPDASLATILSSQIAAWLS